MKLSKNQIEFIDKFLQRNEVVFIDVREEMIDHIASAIEEKMITDNADFHDTFVSYVNLNRKELFMMNKNIWRFSFSEIKSYLLYFLKPASLSVNFFLLVLFFLFRTNENVVLFKDNFRFYFIIEKNSIVLMLLYWINIFLLKPFENNKTISDVLVLIFMMMCSVYVIYAFEKLNTFLKRENR